MKQSSEIHPYARVFVFLIYACVGLSFIATTAVLAYEFREARWLDFARMDSHLFLYFPTLGIVALVAFYLPSCAITDLYWRHVPFGKLRFIVGALVISGLSYLVATNLLMSPKRSMWEIAPSVLQSDEGDPAGCAEKGICERMPAPVALRNLRHVSQERFGLAEFIRNCEQDTLLELRSGPSSKRFCFASTPLSQSPRLQSDAECCRAQQRLSTAISTLFSDPERRSLVAKVHAWLLPFKVFFLLVLLFISIQLVSRHRAMEEHYPRSMPRIEISVIIGAAAVLLFPMMSQAFAQSSQVLYGLSGRGTFSRNIPVVSLAFGVWALLMVLFFYRRRDKELEAFVKMGSAVAGAIAVLKYSIVTAIFVRMLGSGADVYTIGALLSVCIVTIVMILVLPRILK